MIKFNDTLQKLFKERYYAPTENTPQDVFSRVSKFVANGDKELEKEYYDTMNNGDWMPSTPFLMNAGTAHPMNSACFALDIEDSIESIFETLKRTANIFKLGGGVGINFSKLREKNAIIESSKGQSSGVISWMKLFNGMAEEVKQGGKRRGAMIGILNYNHPDIMEFITAKTNGQALTNFNISVMVDDIFMNKVIHNEEYDLISPKNNKVVGKLNAKEVFNKICENNYKYAEPALLFKDNINNVNTMKNKLGNIISCNPCFSGDTLIQTKNGHIRIQDLIDKKVDIWNGYEWSEVEPKITGYNQKVIDVEFSNGATIKCTPYHKFILKHNLRKEAKDLEIGDIIDTFLNSNTLKEIKNIEITNIIDNNEVLDKVYCLTEPKNHSVIANGIMTGQCGEIPLYPDCCCSLASINLDKMLFETKRENNEIKYAVDLSKLEKTTKLIVEFLDTSLTIQEFPDKQIKSAVQNLRQLGLGITGLHNMLIKLELGYDTKEGRNVAKAVMKFITTWAKEKSIELATKLGTFPYYEYEIPRETPRRNWACTTIAPTGTLSQVLGYVSSGCEPEFAFGYSRKIKNKENIEEETLIVSPSIEEFLKRKGIYSQELIKKIIDNKGRVTGLAEIKPEWQIYLKTAQEISYQDHLKMQSALQSSVDNAISKTINLDNSATIEDIKDVYFSAWASGIKGTTVYRDGSLDSQVLTTSSTPTVGDTKKIKEDTKDTPNINSKTANGVALPSNTNSQTSIPPSIAQPLQVKLEPQIRYNSIIPISRKTIGKTKGATYYKKTACGTLYITLNTDENNNLIESFINTSKGGICNANISGLNRMVSVALRSGTKVEEIVDQLKGINCPACTRVSAKGEKLDGISCSDILGKTIEEFYNDLKDNNPKDNEIKDNEIENKQSAVKPLINDIPTASTQNVCPECGKPTRHEGGCLICTECGWSKCS